MASPDTQIDTRKNSDKLVKIASLLGASLIALSLHFVSPNVSIAGNENPQGSVINLKGNCPGNWIKGEAKNLNTFCLGGNGNNYVKTESGSQPILVYNGREYPAVFTDPPHRVQVLANGINFRMVCDGPKDPWSCEGGEILPNNSVIKAPVKTKQVVAPKSKPAPKQVTQTFSESIVKRNVIIKDEDLGNYFLILLFAAGILKIITRTVGEVKDVGNRVENGVDKLTHPFRRN